MLSRAEHTGLRSTQETETHWGAAGVCASFSCLHSELAAGRQRPRPRAGSGQGAGALTHQPFCVSGAARFHCLGLCLSVRTTELVITPSRSAWVTWTGMCVLSTVSLGAPLGPGHWSRAVSLDGTVAPEARRLSLQPVCTCCRSSHPHPAALQCFCVIRQVGLSHEARASRKKGKE